MIKRERKVKRNRILIKWKGITDIITILHYFKENWNKKHIYFHLDWINKGAKLVEVESPEKDAYIQILAINLTGKPDSLVCLQNNAF